MRRRLVSLLRQKVSRDDWAEGIDWYPKAHEQASLLASQYGVSVEAVCGVIAALSPGAPWMRNVADAHRLLRAYVGGEPIPFVGSYGRRNVDKALACIESDPIEVLSGPKVTAFYECLVCPEHTTSVVVDRHSKGVAIGKRGERETVVKSVSEYERIADAYRGAASVVGLRPAQAQAILWVYWRKGRSVNHG